MAITPEDLQRYIKARDRYSDFCKKFKKVSIWYKSLKSPSKAEKFVWLEAKEQHSEESRLFTDARAIFLSRRNTDLGAALKQVAEDANTENMNEIAVEAIIESHSEGVKEVVRKADNLQTVLNTPSMKAVIDMMDKRAKERAKEPIWKVNGIEVTKEEYDAAHAPRNPKQLAAQIAALEKQLRDAKKEEANFGVQVGKTREQLLAEAAKEIEEEDEAQKAAIAAHEAAQAAALGVEVDPFAGSEIEILADIERAKKAQKEQV